MKRINKSKAFGGSQEVFCHFSKQLKCEMTFAIYIPEQAKTKKLPALWYLSGLTCTHANVMEKGEYRKVAAELGMIIICPDTSPRGEGVPDEPENWQFGSGAGFYLDATEKPYSNNYKMYSYISKELQSVAIESFPIDASRQGLTGHSMGGHGALTIALKNPKLYKSCSAIAPITQPTTAPWSLQAYKKYLGDDKKKWREYDATCLLDDGYKFPKFLVDQGTNDEFLDIGLKPELLKEACQRNQIEIELRYHEGYDHSYYFISSVLGDHLRWHNKYLK